MRVLVGCEKSGIVRNAFAEMGHDAWSCDLCPSDLPGKHFQCDITTIVDFVDWDLIIVFPDCTALCVSGNSTYAKGKPGHHKRMSAITWTYALWVQCLANSKRVALENPVGVLCSMTNMPKPHYIQPYDFGEDARKKKTGLFLHGLSPLEPTERIKGRIVNHVERWSNQTDKGDNNLSPSANRAEIRGRTYLGIANAMAQQWGSNT